VCVARVHIQFILYFATIFGILTRDYLIYYNFAYIIERNR